MMSASGDHSATIDITESRNKMASKREVPYVRVEAAQGSNIKNQKGGWKKGIAVLDFILRLGATAAALGAAIAMGSSDETLPFFTKFFQFSASYDELPTFQFFVIVMGIVGAYLVLSLPFSMVTIIRPHAVAPKLVLLISYTYLDVHFASHVLTWNSKSCHFIIIGACLEHFCCCRCRCHSLAQNGNSDANRFAIGQQFGDFCRQSSGAVVSAFVSVVIFVILILLSVNSI
ncbi:hypothetical protein ACFX14_002473 [Malus domestica]